MEANDKYNKRGTEKSEKGLEEHEKANYTAFPADEPTGSREDKGGEKDKADIRQTDKEEETDSVGGGGDLAGNAAGNT